MSANQAKTSPNASSKRRRKVNSPASKFHQEMQGKLNKLKTGGSSLLSSLPANSNRGISASDTSDTSLDSSVNEEIRFLTATPPPKVVSYGTRAVEKELSKRGIKIGKTNLKREKLEDIKEEIDNYYFVERIRRRTKLSKEQFEDLCFALSFATPLLMLFMYEYFLGSQLASMLWSLASSKTVMMLEAIQYVPLIINIRHYKMIGDVDDISYYTHFYFHCLSYLFINDTTSRVIQLLLCLQLIYLINLMWKHILYSGQQALEIFRSSVIFVLAITIIDLTFLKFMKSGRMSATFRGFTLISLQSVRYLAQINHNNKQRHCAVESVESHLLALGSAAAKVYVGLFDRNIVSVVGYSLCFVSNTYLAYQIVLMQDSSRAFIEREQILRENLPKEQKLKRQSFSLKYKPGYKVMDIDEDEDVTDDDVRTEFSETTQIADRFDHGPMM